MSGLITTSHPSPGDVAGIDADALLLVGVVFVVLPGTERAADFVATCDDVAVDWCDCDCDCDCVVADVDVDGGSMCRS